MAVDKLVDSTQLDADLTSVADAIRTKGGTSASLAFPSGFVSAINAIPTGGGGATIQPLSVTQNGTYTAPTGVDGYSPVTVNVSGGSGINVDDIAMKTISGVISGNAQYVASMAFQSCSLLTGAIFPNVLSISGSAFAYCSSLSYVEFPNVEAVQANAFYRCSSLTEVSFPKATFINNAAFNLCSSLTKVSLPSASNISAQAFSSCALLSDVYIPNVDRIGSSAFWSCKSLTTVRLEKVTRISTTAFAWCTNLSQVYILGSVKCSFMGSVFGSTPMTDSSYLGYWGSIYVPSSMVSDYKTTSNWSIYADRITSYVE